MNNIKENDQVKNPEKPEAAGDGRVEKYLTQMKELPTTPTQEDVQKEKPASQPAKPAAPVAKAEPVVKTTVEKQTLAPVDEDTKNKKPVKVKEEADLNDSAYKVYSTRDVILGVINLLTLIFLVFLLLKLPARAQEVRDMRNESMKYKTGSAFELPDIADAAETAEKIDKVFLDTGGIVEFVSRVESIKAQGGAITKLSFTNQSAIKDSKTQNYGIPVLIDMRGDLPAILDAIDKIQNLPFLFRPVTIEIAPNKDDPALLEMKYGGLIYVSDKLGKN